jgi:hypothetical protein
MRKLATTDRHLSAKVRPEERASGRSEHSGDVMGADW